MRRLLVLLALLFVACGEKGPASGVRNACAVAQDVEVSLEALIDAVSDHETAKSEHESASRERDEAARQELSQLVGDEPMTGAVDLGSANAAEESARLALVAAQTEWIAADREFVVDLRRFSRAASRSNDSTLEATASDMRTRAKATADGGLRKAFDACEKAGVPVRIAPSVEKGFYEESSHRR